MATAPPVDAAPPPDVALLCPLCDYDLRAQTQPRCPECGYHFDWDEIRDPARRLHPYAFENHPERNAWSFRRTLLGGLRPRRFWRTLYPTQPARPARLVLYWLLAVACCAAPLVLHVARAWPVVKSELTRSHAQRVQLFAHYAANYQQYLLEKYGALQAAIDAMYPPPSAWAVLGHLVRYSMTTRVLMLFAGLLLLWPWLTFATLMVFQASMRRARVKPAHVMRAVLYSGDVAVWATLLLLLATAWDVKQHGWLNTGGWDANLLSQSALLVCTLTMLLLLWRLAAAYRHYLRFDHAFATAAASQVMVWLVLMKLILDGEVLRMY